MDTNRMASSAGQMKAARTAKPAPSEARDRSRACSSMGGLDTRPRLSLAASMWLALDVQAVGVGGLLLVASLVVGDLVPAPLDLLHGLVAGDLPGQELGHRRVQDHALVLGRLGDPQVEDHVRALEAVADRAQVVLGGLLAHAGLDPQLGVRELGGAVGVEAGL